MSKVGDRIRVLRKMKGISQAQLADAMNLKRSAIGNYEQGIREPDLDTIEAFADYFNVSLADIMGREEGNVSLSETEDKENPEVPKTEEARIVSGWMDSLPKEQREWIVDIVRTVVRKPE